MTKTNLNSIPEHEQRSPNARYHIFRKNISKPWEAKRIPARRAVDIRLTWNWLAFLPVP